jgi:predicted nucleic acid-binding protein
MPTATGAEESPVAFLDTSAAVALVVEDHEAHEATVEAVGRRRMGLAGHAWFETYSVLTRLPPGLRRSPAEVSRLLAHDFPETGFLSAEESSALGKELADLGISGGGVYDALVAAAARHHDRPLISGDARARQTYEALGVTVEVIRDPG